MHIYLKFWVVWRRNKSYWTINVFKNNLGVDRFIIIDLTRVIVLKMWAFASFIFAHCVIKILIL